MEETYKRNADFCFIYLHYTYSSLGLLSIFSTELNYWTNQKVQDVSADFKLPCVLGHLLQMFIQIWNLFVASLCLCCWTDVGYSEHHIACSNYRSYWKLECALLSMIYAYLNLSPHQSSPLLVWFKSPQLNMLVLVKLFSPSSHC